ncbi:MAG: transcription termination/antitermination protein NusA [Deltaproteobacteria bacterium]|nr:transcription termination/antitermination protein NusA [Deltaproteobacteria bacterium]
MATKKQQPQQQTEAAPNLNYLIDTFHRERGVDKTVLVDALIQAILTAARRKFGPEHELEAQFNEDTGEVEVFECKVVVETVTNPIKEILVTEAQADDPEIQLGDTQGKKLEGVGFGRIDAQTAKQVLIQRVREAERAMIYNEYKDRKGEIITGIARRFERGNIIVEIGRAEAILPVREQVPRESYRLGDRVQAYVKEIERNPKGPQIVLSRTHVGLLQKLFEQEVPEIYEAIVKIEAAAREPGGRSKIAVSSRDSDVDPVGACVGMKGSRVQAVVQELRGEKIDIVPFSIDPARFVCDALLPAKVARVIIDEGKHAMEIIVPDDQLSLAIGRKGQNVRLASQLSGWHLDIIAESKMRELTERQCRLFTLLDGISMTMAEQLYKFGYTSIQEIADGEANEVSLILGRGTKFAADVQERAREMVKNGIPELPPEPVAEDEEKKNATTEAQSAAQRSEGEEIGGKKEEAVAVAEAGTVTEADAGTAEKAPE